jgi:hypothetical protein
MPLSVECPSCGEECSFPERVLSKRVACPHCADPITLPPAGGAAFESPLAVTVPPAIIENLPIAHLATDFRKSSWRRVHFSLRSRLCH